MPTKSSGRFTAPDSSVIGSVEVFEASSASGFTTSCTSPYTRALSAGSSKTASITESQPARSAGSAVGVIRARISAFLSSRHPAARDRLVEDRRGVGLALLGGLDADVLEHDLDAGAGGRVGDAGAHHPGAEHAELRGGELLDALGPQLAGVDRLQVEEERLDHVLGVLADDQLGEVARLDPRRGLEVDLRALDGRGQDRARRRVVRALGLLAQVGRERRQERRELGVAGRAAGHPVARPVPRLYGGLLVVAVLEDPRLGGRDQVVRVGDELVDEPLLEGRRRA